MTPSQFVEGSTGQNLTFNLAIPKYDHDVEQFQQCQLQSVCVYFTESNQIHSWPLKCSNAGMLVLRVGIVLVSCWLETIFVRHRMLIHTLAPSKLFIVLHTQSLLHGMSHTSRLNQHQYTVSSNFTNLLVVQTNNLNLCSLILVLATATKL